MSRELAHHAPETQSPDFAAALVVHRAVPSLSIVELCRRAKLPGPARRAVEHAVGCADCRVGDLCMIGSGLAERIRQNRRRRRRAAA